MCAINPKLFFRYLKVDRLQSTKQWDITVNGLNVTSTISVLRRRLFGMHRRHGQPIFNSYSLDVTYV